MRLWKSQISRYAVSPSLLGLECLETESFLTTPGAIAALDRLKRRGITVSLDDFGIGYSGTACLTSLPPGRRQAGPFSRCDRLRQQRVQRPLTTYDPRKLCASRQARHAFSTSS
ncbi:EAL domain-containing protein (plasmid) [Serratia ureilytica]|nr:EAL domain-containing protein [Serratia ureilytica]